MGGESNNQEQKSTKAKATPTSQKEPVGKVSVAVDKVVVKVFNPSKDPFSKYPIVLSKDVVVQLDLGDAVKKGAVRAAFPGKAQPVEVTVPLTKDEAGKLRKIVIWTEPYGYAALRARPNGSVALGRQVFDVKPPPADGKVRTFTAEVEIVKGVIAFITDEMNRNKLHPDVVACKKTLDEAAKLEKDAEKLEKDSESLGMLEGFLAKENAASSRRRAHQLRKDAGYRWGRKVHTASGPSGVLMSVYFLGGGEWDHKPIIDSTWKNINRLGNSELTYFYDIWSNMHYGYVGRAAGFSAQRLHEGANQQQEVDSGSNDERADYESVQAGFDLYTPSKDVTIDDVIKVVGQYQNWTYEERQKSWGEK